MPNYTISDPMLDYSGFDYDNNKDIIKSLIKERQEQEKRLKENELLFSTYRGKYGDRNEARYLYPKTEGKNETIPSTESRMKDARYAKAYNEAVKELMQDAVAEEMAEAIGDRMKYNLYGSGLNLGEGDDGSPLFFDTQRDLVNDWKHVQKERQDAELDKSLKPAELRAKEYPSKAEAFLFGYDPDDDGEFDVDVLDAGYFVPGVGSAMYGGNVLDRVRRGGMPGFVETAMVVPVVGPGIKRGAQAFYKAYKAAPAKRFAKKWNNRQNLTPLDYARTQLFDREGKLVDEW